MDTSDYIHVDSNVGIDLHPQGVRHIDVTAKEEGVTRWLRITMPSANVTIFLGSSDEFQAFADKVAEAARQMAPAEAVA